MTIQLPEHLERYIHDQVLAGRFRTEDDVILDALERHRQAQQPPADAPAMPDPDPGLHARRRRADGRDRRRRLPPPARGDLAGNRPLNKALLDTDIFSEITKGVNPTVAAHATAYRQAFSRYTISAVTFMEVVRGEKKGPPTDSGCHKARAFSAPAPYPIGWRPARFWHRCQAKS